MFPMLKWWFLENGVWKIHIHIRKIQVIEVFFFANQWWCLLWFFSCVAIFSMRRTTIYKPPPKKNTHRSRSPQLTNPTNNPTNGRSSEVETQCCRYDHLNLWLRAGSGCYDSGRTTTCDRYTWCGCGNGIYLRSRRKVVEGVEIFWSKKWGHMSLDCFGDWIWLIWVFVSLLSLDSCRIWEPLWIYRDPNWTKSHEFGGLTGGVLGRRLPFPVLGKFSNLVGASWTS